MKDKRAKYPKPTVAASSSVSPKQQAQPQPLNKSKFADDFAAAFVKALNAKAGKD